MKEVTGNLWTYPADVRVITTNGFVKKDGKAVMGRGCALEAAKRWPTLPYELGKNLKIVGNVPVRLRQDAAGAALYTFPVKHHWYQKADLALIKQSAKLLVDKLDPLYPNDGGHVIVIPRPGCGNGQLRWEDVKPVLEPIFDDRFHIITFGKE
jgi:hypothetical protein